MKTLLTYFSLIVCLCFTACSMTPPVMLTDEATRGWTQGVVDAQPNTACVAAGAGCGVFGIGAAYVWDYQPPADSLIGKSPEYVAMYTRAYREKMRAENAKKAAIGWGIWLAYLVVLASADGG